MPHEEAAASWLTGISRLSIPFFPFAYLSRRVSVVLVPILGLNPESPSRGRAHAHLIPMHSTGSKESQSQNTNPRERDSFTEFSHGVSGIKCRSLRPALVCLLSPNDIQVSHPAKLS